MQASSYGVADRPKPTTPATTPERLWVQAQARPSSASKATAPATAKARIVGDRQVDSPDEPVVLSEQTEPSPFRFAEIAAESGINFIHFSGMTAEKYFPTANGSGVAIFDYDNDGKLDLYFATATLLPLGTAKKGPNRLYKNLGDNKFEDVTEAAGVGFAGFCHGIVVGDIDNDGDARISSSATTAPNVLYLNKGDGTFTDISKSAGIDRPTGPQVALSSTTTTMATSISTSPITATGSCPRTTSSAASSNRSESVSTARQVRSRPAKHFLYRNNGDLTFTDVYDQAILTIDPETVSPDPSRRPRFRRRHGRPQRRRPDRHLRRQRHEPELPLPQPRRRHV